MASILCVDGDPPIGLILEDTLQRAGHAPVIASDLPEALRILARGGIDLIISHDSMPGMPGLEPMEVLRREGLDIPTIVLTGHECVEHAVASMAGASGYVTKPVQPRQLALAVDQALEVVRLRRENDALRREVAALRNERQIVGEAQVTRLALHTVAMAAPSMPQLGDSSLPAGPYAVLGAGANGNGNGSHAPVVLHTLDVNEAERVLIARALETCGGNRTKAAGLLGINVRTLRNKLNGKG